LRIIVSVVMPMLSRTRFIRWWTRVVATYSLATASAVLVVAMAHGQEAPLRVGGDAEGGAPFVEADPRDPSRVVGFEVDIAALIAAALTREWRFVQAGFTTLDASTVRGDFDIALSGVEDTPARRSRLAVTVPYYEFREVLTVREVDAARFRSLDDLAGRRVATLGATLAFDILQRAAVGSDVLPVAYEDDVHPYTDLALGRVDAVLLDAVLAERGVRRNPGLVNVQTPAGAGRYVGILSPSATALRDEVDEVLKAAMRDGRLEAIFRKWGMWNTDQPRLYARVLAGSFAEDVDRSASSDEAVSVWVATLEYLPSLLRAAVITLVLSFVSMGLAVAIGAAIASGRVYGGPLLRRVLAAWVEVIRGTPLLLQLFVVYFGLATVVQLPAALAAVLALGLNYAAYESEIYRGALEAVPVGQLDAARVLGLTDWQALRLVRGPQAVRAALAPMTNDFVALLKDSSLVSVITVVELTKQTSIFAANIGSWLVPGLVCAAMYLAMSLPLARLARRLERRWSPA
jgi:polar amino acid transport system substrate-binding protein